MTYRLLADAVVALHLVFIVFVIGGGLLVLRWRRVAWLHVPSALWGVVIELTGWICPLTPLEQWLRLRGGEAGYEGGFIDHYILPIVYPGLARAQQVALGGVVLVVNVATYWIAWRRLRRHP